MAVRYQKARLAVAGLLTVGVITGTAYFAAIEPPAGPAPVPTNAPAASSPVTVSVEAPKAPARPAVARRSRGS